MFALVTVRGWRDWLPVAAYSLLWGAVYGFLLLTRHPTWVCCSVAIVSHMNLSGDFFTFSIPNNAALAPLFILILAGWRLNPFLRRLSWAAPFYIAPLVVAALWWEIRLWLPLIVMLLPIGLLYLEAKQKPPTNGG